MHTRSINLRWNNGVEDQSITFTCADPVTVYHIALQFLSVHAMELDQTITLACSGVEWTGGYDEHAEMLEWLTGVFA